MFSDIITWLVSKTVITLSWNTLVFIYFLSSTSSTILISRVRYNSDRKIGKSTSSLVTGMELQNADSYKGCRLHMELQNAVTRAVGCTWSYRMQTVTRAVGCTWSYTGWRLHMELQNADSYTGCRLHMRVEVIQQDSSKPNPLLQSF
jgi:hypothetical protein